MFFILDGTLDVLAGDDIVAAGPGDLAGHLRWYRLGLHNHHQGEDELIWPLLRARVNLLPVAGHHLNRAEWDALGQHFLATTPKRQLLIFLGAVLEDADMSERASVLMAMPAVPRWIWRTAGQQIYARRMRHLRGRP